MRLHCLNMISLQRKRLVPLRCQYLGIDKLACPRSASSMTQTPTLCSRVILKQRLRYAVSGTAQKRYLSLWVHRKTCWRNFT
jgi:hypothetical protein